MANSERLVEGVDGERSPGQMNGGKFGRLLEGVDGERSPGQMNGGKFRRLVEGVDGERSPGQMNSGKFRKAGGRSGRREISGINERWQIQKAGGRSGRREISVHYYRGYSFRIKFIPKNLSIIHLEQLRDTVQLIEICFEVTGGVEITVSHKS